MRSSKAELETFLTVINAETDKLPNEQIMKLWMELRRIAYGDFGPFVLRDSEITEGDKSRKDLTELQSLLYKSVQFTLFGSNFLFAQFTLLKQSDITLKDKEHNRPYPSLFEEGTEGSEAL